VLFSSRPREKGVITEVPTSIRGPRLSHLFFADWVFMRKGQGSSSICPRPLFSLVGILAKGEDQKFWNFGFIKSAPNRYLFGVAHICWQIKDTIF
jgi:hypothetical protein